MTSPNRSQGPKRPGLSVAVASEAVKLLTLPRLRFLALVVVVLGTATALLFYLTLPVTQGRTLAELAPSEVLSVGLLGIDAAALVLIVFAALVVGDEYTTGMMQTTLTLTPARDRVLGAKLVVVGLTALAVGVVTAGCCLGIGLSFGASAGFAPAELLAAGAWQRAAGGVAMPVCYA
ncbi:MAG: hypothetical protein Q4D79_06655, partial [Propionibacteriaceae bacterium]|nr:hypothetical protein [Propionibacteriaceae bacterium]